MAYSADTFVADEQPTTAKWNKLWANDAAFNDGTGIANNAITANHISGFSYSNATTISNPYKVSVYANAGQALTSANTPYTLALNTERYDTNNNFNTSTYTYTVPVDGFYFVAARCKGATIGSGNRIYLDVRGADGVILSGNDIDGTGAYPAAVVAGVVQRTAAQTIYFTVTSTAASKNTQYDDANSINAQIHLLSRT